ncbi:MAG: hypothetical protein CME62_06485 [Halobacteriovoraceae bacterium]|nr:hypothetical protein [Halobacteriovoraceae bacterium]|tara:strand:+ start:13134 stop:14618 length:1485 start_codon:yes stop_codon:yes gene_type:complete
MSFFNKFLPENINRAIAELGYKEPTEIQSQAIPMLINDPGDFVGQAQTGTGKTAAFCLPLLTRIDEDAEGIQALILSPTRELANQIQNDIKDYAKYTHIKATTVYGGVGYKQQIDGLRKSQIVVATPGRAIDLIKSGKLKLNTVHTFIVDEADEMLKMGFIEDVEMIMENFNSEVSTWMFSATMPKPILNLMQTKLHYPKVIKVEAKTLTNNSVEQTYLCLHKKDFLKGLQTILLSDTHLYGIIFCEMKVQTNELCEKLEKLGVNAIALNGDLNQKQRDQAVNLFKNRKAQVMVCTDVAARGLDISDITHVINIGLPRKHDSYVHRIGRTGRAGKKGMAITIVEPNQVDDLRKIEKLTKTKMEKYNLPSLEETKVNRVHQVLGKMQKIKTAVVQKGDDFDIDESFHQYAEYFENLNKEEVLKLMFTMQLNQDMRQLTDSFDIECQQFAAPKFRPRRRGEGRSRRSGGGRNGGRRREGNRNMRSGGARQKRSISR